VKLNRFCIIEETNRACIDILSNNVYTTGLAFNFLFQNTKESVEKARCCMIIRQGRRMKITPWQRSRLFIEELRNMIDFLSAYISARLIHRV
jgi:hypothetical protein